MTFPKTYLIDGAFRSFIAAIKREDLAETCKELYHYPDFWTHTASTGFHHAFDKGLIVHTLEVTGNACHIAKIFPAVNMDVLITAALWHDLAKIWDYQKNNGKWEKTPYHKLVHHISGSMSEFTSAAKTHGVDVPTIHAIQHAMLAHHGCVEYGTVKNPNTLEAIILHQADMLSAHSPFNNSAPID